MSSGWFLKRRSRICSRRPNTPTARAVDTSTNAVVGTGLASGSSIVITTSNVSALGDGTYQLAARQLLEIFLKHNEQQDE